MPTVVHCIIPDCPHPALSDCSAELCRAHYFGCNGHSRSWNLNRQLITPPPSPQCVTLKPAPGWPECQQWFEWVPGRSDGPRLKAPACCVGVKEPTYDDPYYYWPLND